MSEYTVVGAAELVRKFNRIPAAIRQDVGQRMMTTAALLVENRVKKLISGDLLKVRSGRLRASIGHSIRGEGDSIVARVSTRVAYAKLQEYGGTVTPRRTKFLTIPIGEALTPAGVARYTARDIINNPGLGNFDGTFFAKGMLFGKRRENIFPIFALKTSVKITPKHYMKRGLNDTRSQIVQSMHRAIDRVLKTT